MHHQYLLWGYISMDKRAVALYYTFTPGSWWLLTVSMNINALDTYKQRCLSMAHCCFNNDRFASRS